MPISLTLPRSDRQAGASKVLSVHGLFVNSIRGAKATRPPATQYLPARYNRQTELEITIESGSGPVTRDFALE